MALGLVTTFLVNLAISALTTAYANERARRARGKQKSAAIAAAFANVRDISSGDLLGEVYGYAAVNGRPVWHHRFADMTAARTQIDGATFASGRVTGNNVASIGQINDPGEGQNNQYLAVQEAVCVGPVDSVINILYDERSSKAAGDGGVRGHVIAEIKGPGETSQAVTTTSASRASAKFTGMTHANAWLKFEPEDPKWGGGLSRTVYFLRNTESRRVFAADGFGAEADDHLNVATAIAHYLTKSLIGPEADDSYINIDAYRAAFAIADAPWKGPAAPAGTTTLPSRPGTAYLNLPQYDRYEDLGMDRTGDAARRSQSFPTGVANFNYRRGQVVGHLGSAQTFRQALDLFLQCFPGAVDFEDQNGQHRIVFPDGVATEATQASATVRSSDFIEGTGVQITYPGENDRYNRVILNFTDIHQDFAVESVVFPEPGSAADTKLLELDRGKRLSITIDAPLIGTTYHANSAAANELLQSRRERYSFQVRRTETTVDIAPGDVIRLVVPERSLDVFVRIVDDPQPQGAGLAFSAIRFSKDDYAWIPYPEGDLTIAAPGGQPLPAPSMVAAALESGKRRVLVTWQMARMNALAVNSFDVRIKRRADQMSSDWEPLGNVPLVADDPAADTLTFSHPYTLGTDEDILQFSVRSVSAAGRRSVWVDSGTLSIAAFSLVPNVGQARIYKRSNTPVGASDLPTGDATYTFATMGIAIDSAEDNGWSGAVPSGTDTLYTRTALAVGAGTTTTIAPSEWGPALAGAVAGADGANFGIVELWTATNAFSAPGATTLPGSVVWTFSPPSVTSGLPANSIWKRTQALAGLTTGQYLWVARAAAGSGSATQIINRSDFSIGLHSRVGIDGNGQEEIWRLGTLADRTAFLQDPSAWTGLPASAFPYEQPVAPWVDDQPSTTSAMPVAFRAVRTAPVTAQPGDASTNFGPWDVAALVLYGTDGKPGVRGPAQTFRVDDREALGTNADGLGQYAVVPNPTSGAWSQFLAMTRIHIGTFEQDGRFNVLAEYLQADVPAGAVLTFYVASDQWADFLVTANDSAGSRGVFDLTRIESSTPASPVVVSASTDVEIRLDAAPRAVIEFTRTMYKLQATAPTDQPAPARWEGNTDTFTGGNFNGWLQSLPATGRGDAAKVWARDINILTRRPHAVVQIPTPQPWGDVYLASQDGAGTERVYWQGAAAGQTQSQVPREQTLTAPAPTINTSGTYGWQGASFSDPLLSAFVGSGGTAYLRELAVFNLGSVGNNLSLRFRVSSADSGTGSEAGPDLTDQWEGNWELTISFGAQSWTVDHSMFSSLDNTEPYQFTGGTSAARSQIVEAQAAIGSSAGATVTIRDGATTTAFTTTPADTPPLLNNNWPVGQPVAPWQSTQPAWVFGMDIYVAERNPTQSTAWVGPTLLPRPLEIVKVSAGATPQPADIAPGSGKLVVRTRT